MNVLKIKIKGNVFRIYCNYLNDFVFNKVNELLNINNNIKVEVYINNK